MQIVSSTVPFCNDASSDLMVQLLSQDIGDQSTACLIESLSALRGGDPPLKFAAGGVDGTGRSPTQRNTTLRLKGGFVQTKARSPVPSGGVDQRNETPGLHECDVILFTGSVLAEGLEALEASTGWNGKISSLLLTFISDLTCPQASGLSLGFLPLSDLSSDYCLLAQQCQVGRRL